METLSQNEPFLIPYTGKGGTVVDWKDMPMASAFTWRDDHSGYAITQTPRNKGKRKNIRLHRLLMGFPDNHIDHINRKRFDNRRFNLREVNDRENSHNRSNHGLFPVGVNYHKRDGKFTTGIYINGKLNFLGYFIDPISGKIILDFVKGEL